MKTIREEMDEYFSTKPVWPLDDRHMPNPFTTEPEQPHPFEKALNKIAEIASEYVGYNIMVTPLYIEIALHYVCCVDDFPRKDAPACNGAIRDMESRGLIREVLIPGSRQFEPTEGLRMWVNELCKVPFPVNKWVMP